jgi:putative spermidine/putrescine transport system permease protein
MHTDRLTWRGALLMAPLLVSFGIFYVYPLVQLLLSSFQENGGWSIKHYRDLLNNPIALTVFLRTGQLALTVTLLTLVLGYPFAFLLATRGGRIGTLLLAAVLFPFWISVLVRTYAWMVLLGRHGVLNNLLLWLGIRDTPLTLLYNQIGVHIGMVYVLLPLMTLPIYSSMVSFDRNLIRAAHSLGCKPVESLRRVYLPLTFPGVAAGIILVFMVSFGFFVTPAMIGGSRDITVAMLVHKAVTSELNWSSGAAMSTVLLLITIATFVTSGKLWQRSSGQRADGTLVG